LEKELENRSRLDLAFTHRMPIVPFLNAVTSGTTLDQRLDMVLENHSRKMRRTREER
jgi:hypothetical protein